MNLFAANPQGATAYAKQAISAQGTQKKCQMAEAGEFWRGQKPAKYVDSRGGGRWAVWFGD